MIIIFHPKLRIVGDSAIISAKFKSQGETDELWYKVPVRYKDSILIERLDAFLVGLLFLGLKTGQDIKLEAPISERLFYNISHYLINVLCFANSDFQKITLIADQFDATRLNDNNAGTGTGLTCGIDSFATYYDHILEKGSYAIDYLTFFNVGSHGDFGGEKARKLYLKRAKTVSEFAENEVKEFITIDSNLSEILKMNFQKTNTLRSISCVLVLQKLFKNYYFASSYRFDHFKLVAEDTSYYDLFNLALLSTESTNLFSTGCHLTRIEKTDLISNFQDTYSTLDVCVELNKSENIKNCSKCDKCLRTALSLELLGKLEHYNKVFNLDVYYNHRDHFIGKIKATKGQNIFNAELWELLKEKEFIRLIHFWEFYKVKYKDKKKYFKKMVKKKLNRD